MEVKALRGLMIGALVLTVASEVVAAAGDPWWSIPSDPDLRQGALFATSFTAIFGVVALISFVAMYNLRSWGRTLALATTIAGLMLWAFALHIASRNGTALPASPFIVLDHIAALCWGGAFALAYFSPLKARFGANNSFKPKSLRSSNNMA